MGRIAVASIVALWVIPISVFVNRAVPVPYMDEIFHVPQAQQYCGGNFTGWDPMITTPPGLYFVSLAYIASLFPGLLCLRAVSSLLDLCSTSILRLTNSFLAVICSILIYDIIALLRPSLEAKKATFFTLALSLYPLHWFFTYLYYTDVASLTSVLAMYFLALKKKYLLSSFLGALSVFIRQTNIIWVLFIACTGILEFAHYHQKDHMEVDDLNSSKEKDSISCSSGIASKSSNVRRRQSVSTGKDMKKHYYTSKLSVLERHSPGLTDEIQVLIIVSWNHLWELLLTFSPFLMVLVAFAAFVYWNGSIVLGAKDAHTVSPHFAQLLYFGIVSALFAFPIHFSPGQLIFQYQQFRKSKLVYSIWWCVASTISFISVQYFSIAHPYLLADNRHYTFYLWRKVINYHWSMKYLMIPLYVYSWSSIISSLGKNRKKLWVLIYFFACAATLIPAPLIEFRYYTIPFFFMVLHTTETADYKSLLAMGIMYVSINCFTIFMFLFRPFSWNHEAGTQRFIW